MLPTLPQRVRAVVHLDVNRAMIEQAASVIRRVMEGPTAPASGTATGRRPAAVSG
jgi:hypothetical protein